MLFGDKTKSYITAYLIFQAQISIIPQMVKKTMTPFPLTRIYLVMQMQPRFVLKIICDIVEGVRATGNQFFRCILLFRLYIHIKLMLKGVGQ